MAGSLPRGIFPAVLTPFDEHEQINWPVLERLIEQLMGAGVHGLYVGGAASECFYLTMPERQELAERAMAVAGGALPVIVHVACGSTRDALQLARHAERSGAAAVASVPPYFFPLTPAETLAYYRELAAAVSIPVLAYYFPALTGVQLSTSDLDALAEIPNLAGFKFTSFHLHQMIPLKCHPARPTVYNGYDEILLAGLSMGADGGVGSYYNVVPELVLEIWDAFNRGDVVSAGASQRRLTELIRQTFNMGGHAAVKTLLRARGLDCGQRRRPAQPVSIEQQRQLLAYFDRWKAEQASPTSSRTPLDGDGHLSEEVLSKES